MILNALGGGLIAGGSLVLLWTFLGSDPGESFGQIERDRRERNAWLASRSAAVVTGAGAVLLLVPAGRWPYAAASAVVGVAVAHAVLVHKTHAEYVRVRTHVRGQVARNLPVSMYEGMLLGLQAQEPQSQGVDLLEVKFSTPIPMDVISAESEKRASWRWAITHPTGARSGEGM